jgi:hypothetical protein
MGVGLRGRPELIEQRAHGGNRPVALHDGRAGFTTARINGHHCDAPVEDDQPQRQDSGGTDLASQVNQPSDIASVLRVVAHAVQVDRQNLHAAAQQHLVQWLACFEVLRGLRPVWHQRQNLPLGVVGQLGQLGPDGVEPENLGKRDSGGSGNSFSRQLGDQRRDSGAAVLDLMLALKQPRLLPCHQVAEGDIRADQMDGSLSIPLRPYQ